ncbi:MAG: site-specific integrase [bacterium]|nr:site-specific integrase [Acidimicrobiia bacterium]MCY4649193.1 site-specific integrase [bacterium]
MAKNRSGEIPTFREAAGMVLDLQAEGGDSGSKRRRVAESILNLHVYPFIGDKKLDQILSPELMACLDRIWFEKRVTAHKAFKQIRAVMRWGLAHEFIERDPTEYVRDGLGPNPARTVHMPSQHHSLIGEDLEAIEGSKAYWATKAAVRFLVLTANRPGAVRGARWEEFDLARAIWTIPANRAKNREAFEVPLSLQALSVLHEAREHTGGVGLVFPSRRGLPISDSTMSKLFREHRVGSVPYGFRSTFRVWCAEVGVARQVAEPCLEHICDGVRPAQSPVEHRRQVLEAWGHYLFPIVPPR